MKSRSRSMFRQMCQMGALAVLSAGCSPRVAPLAAPPPVVESPAGEGSDEDPEAEGGEPANAPFLGVVLTGETVEVAPKTDGRLEALLVKPGDRVKRGAVLAVLDRRLLRQNLAVARAQLSEAEERLARRVPLAQGDGTISREELSTTRMEVLEQQSKVNGLKQALAEAEIRSPVDGTVAARFYEPGALTQPGRPILRLISASVPKVRFAIPEGRVAAVAVGAQVSVVIDGMERPLVARVESVAPE